MQSHLIALLLAAVAIGVATANPSLVSGPSRMFELMSATSDAQRANPSLTAACFGYYQGVFDDDYQVYQKEYNGCVDEFGAGRNGVLEKYNSRVWDLSNSTYASCKALIACDQRENSLESLNCYSAQGTNNSKEVYSIATSASFDAGTLNQEIINLGFTRDLCCNNSARNYETRYTLSYIDFQSCLAGKSPVPVPTTTTSKPEPTTTTTTPEPPTTPASSSSDWEPSSTPTPEPSSSSAPEPSTVAPFSQGASSSEEKMKLMNKLDEIFKHLL